MTILYRVRLTDKGIEMIQHPSADVLTGNDERVKMDRQLVHLLETMRRIRRQQSRALVHLHQIWRQVDSRVEPWR